jgi:hypothetical protein
LVFAFLVLAFGGFWAFGAFLAFWGLFGLFDLKVFLTFFAAGLFGPFYKN